MARIDGLEDAQATFMQRFVFRTAARQTGAVPSPLRIMARNPAVDRDDPEVRASLYREYGELMSAIRGCYVTAEDVGTSVEDMARVFSRTRHTTCIPEDLGGSGNPSVPTARGVICMPTA